MLEWMSSTGNYSTSALSAKKYKEKHESGGNILHQQLAKSLVPIFAPLLYTG